MQVGSEVNAGREDTLQVLTLALAVELLPPLREEVQLRLEVHHNLNLLTALVQSVTYGSILCSGVLGKWYGWGASLLHLLGTGHQILDAETSAGDRQQSYWSEY